MQYTKILNWIYCSLRPIAYIRLVCQHFSIEISKVYNGYRMDENKTYTFHFQGIIFDSQSLIKAILMNDQVYVKLVDNL